MIAQTARERLAGAVRAGCDGIVLTLDEAATLLNDLEGAETEARVARTLQAAAESREQQLLMLLGDLQERERTLRECVAWYADAEHWFTGEAGEATYSGEVGWDWRVDNGARARAALAATEPEGT